jgi:hypothetical protein
MITGLRSMSIEKRLLLNTIKGVPNPGPKSNNNNRPPATSDLNDAARSVSWGLRPYELSFDDSSWVQRPLDSLG